MIPNVPITKSDGNTGVVKPATSGILAIIAPAQSGPLNQPGSYTRQADALSTFGISPLVEDASYFMNVAKKPALLIRPSTSVAATTTAVQKGTSTGTSAVTATGSALDSYDVIMTVLAGGTIGTGPISYTYSLDGGATTSAAQALGTATTAALSVPNVGLPSGLTLNFGAGTLVTGDQFTFSGTPAGMNNADLVTALEALRVSRLPWDGVFVGQFIATAQTVGTLDAWLSVLEGVGVFKNGWMNTRHKLLPVPTSETEATFATSMGTVLAATSTIRVDVGCDAGDSSSLVTGLLQRRPVALFEASRALGFPVGVDPAYVANGPLINVQISDANGNPKWHDENLYPGLDALRFTTLRSIPGQQGVYLTNANVLSPNGSDFVYLQHVRCMNVACTLAFALLTNRLSLGVRKAPPDGTTGKIYILEQDAAAIEADVNAALGVALKGQVNAVAFQLSRTDDLSSNSGATINAEIQIQALAYIKAFAVTAKFVKSITVTP